MSARELALETLEDLINRVVSLDPVAAQRLAEWHGRVIAIALRGTAITFYFIPDQLGRLQLQGSYEGQTDCRIEGSPLDLMRASDRQQGPAQLFAGHVAISGDTELAHRFSEVLGNLQIDWEEQLSRYVGDVTAHALARFGRDTRDQAQRKLKLVQQNLSEYLTEEARLLPHAFEVEDWIRDVETLRDDVERLAARIQLLENDSA